MKSLRILAVVVALGLAGVSLGQTTFDFEGVTVQDLVDSGWTFIDDLGHTVGGVPTQYLDTIVIETTITHGGSGALRLGVWDLGYFPLNGEFGTLDLWAYDYGYPVQEYMDNAYGGRFGLRKFGDVDVSGYYPDSEPVDYGILNRPYGIGAGLVQRSFLGSDAGYGTEWGSTAHMDIAVISNPNMDYDPAAPAVNAGWAGDQSWWSPTWLGYLPGGRPLMVGGWNHWRIAYLAPGQVEIELVESWAGDNVIGSGTPANAFDGGSAT